MPRGLLLLAACARIGSGSGTMPVAVYSIAPAAVARRDGRTGIRYFVLNELTMTFGLQPKPASFQYKLTACDGPSTLLKSVT